MAITSTIQNHIGEISLLENLGILHKRKEELELMRIWRRLSAQWIMEVA